MPTDNDLYELFGDLVALDDEGDLDPVEVARLADARLLWTLVEGDRGFAYRPGACRVNRVSYWRAERPYPPCFDCTFVVDELAGGQDSSSLGAEVLRRALDAFAAQREARAAYLRGNRGEAQQAALRAARAALSARSTASQTALLSDIDLAEQAQQAADEAARLAWASPY